MIDHDKSRREFLVYIGSVAIGMFTLPTQPEPATMSEDTRKVRRLVLPPERVGKNLLWIEIQDDGEAVSKMWIPSDEADLAEMERFYDAACRVDFDDPGPHEVR